LFLFGGVGFGLIDEDIDNECVFIWRNASLTGKCL